MVSRLFIDFLQCRPPISPAMSLEVKVRDSGEVTFAGPTCTLWLDRPSTFTGKVADFGAQESVDLPGIPFGVHTTLGYSENSSDTGGILSVKEGTHIAKIALLGNYIAEASSRAPTATAARSSRRRRKRRTSYWPRRTRDDVTCRRGQRSPRTSRRAARAASGVVGGAFCR